jgi:hypothetical protein
VLEGSWVHEIKKKELKNDRYDFDKGEERNPKEHVSNNGANRIHTYTMILRSYTSI